VIEAPVNIWCANLDTAGWKWLVNPINSHKQVLSALANNGSLFFGSYSALNLVSDFEVLSISFFKILIFCAESKYVSFVLIFSASYFSSSSSSEISICKVSLNSEGLFAYIVTLDFVVFITTSSCTSL